jgi:LDH2 family malate/lactate/ureidoglycolate dehydrogenase
VTTISISELEALCRAALTRAGVREQDAVIATGHYLENECSGKASHGIVRVVEAAGAAQKSGATPGNPEIAKDSGAIVVFDAKGQIGVVAGKHAMDMAMTRAKKHGIALVGVRNYIASMGSMTWFLRRLAEKNLVALMGCNSVAQVAPPGGCERVIGTNPVGIAVPGADGDALIVDFTTAAIAYGKIMVMKDKGETVPDGVLVDTDGHPSNNPADAYDGAILPLAGYKGFGLGLMVELLAGPLIGAGAVKKNLYDNDGMFIIAIDPQMAGHTGWAQDISAALEFIRKSKRQEGVSEISLPGDRSAKALKEVQEKGQVEVAEKTLEKLRALAL